jgi:hypothetical protein
MLRLSLRPTLRPVMVETVALMVATEYTVVLLTAATEDTAVLMAVLMVAITRGRLLPLPRLTPRPAMVDTVTHTEDTVDTVALLTAVMEDTDVLTDVLMVATTRGRLLPLPKLTPRPAMVDMVALTEATVDMVALMAAMAVMAVLMVATEAQFTDTTRGPLRPSPATADTVALTEVTAVLMAVLLMVAMSGLTAATAAPGATATVTKPSSWVCHFLVEFEHFIFKQRNQKRKNKKEIKSLSKLIIVSKCLIARL